MIKITDTVKHLIIINALFFLGTLVFKEKAYDLLAMHYFENPAFKPWQIVTHIFMHANFTVYGKISITHILFNMIALWMFGSSVEQMIGRKRFLILYFISGIGAVLFSQGIDYLHFHSLISQFESSGMSLVDIHNIYKIPLPAGKGYTDANFQSIYNIYNVQAVGASGAINGIIVAFGVLLPRAKMGLMFLPIMIESRIFIPLLILSDVLFGVFSSNSNIGHFAHVGGAIFGFFVIWYYKNQFKNKYNR